MYSTYCNFPAHPSPYDWRFSISYHHFQFLQVNSPLSGPFQLVTCSLLFFIHLFFCTTYIVFDYISFSLHHLSQLSIFGKFQLTKSFFHFFLFWHVHVCIIQIFIHEINKKTKLIRLTAVILLLKYFLPLRNESLVVMITSFYLFQKKKKNTKMMDAAGNITCTST